MNPSLEPPDCGLRGVRRLELPGTDDPIRGNLTVLEFSGMLPFVPERCFWIHGIPPRQVRGNHAHRHCEQFLVSVHGRCRLHLDDGTRREAFDLDRPEFGILVPSLVWVETSGHSADSVLLVLASQAFDPGDYIRDYRKFLRITRHETP